MTEISNEYAAALFELGLEQGKAREYFNALSEIDGVLKQQPEYAEFLASPAIPVPERVSAVEAAFSAHLPEYVVNFLQLLCEKGRVRIFGECLLEYKRLLEEHEKTSLAKVTSAIALTDAEKASLTAKLVRKTGHSVVIENVVDSSVIAGLIIEVDGKIIDGSVKSILADVKDVISK